MIKEVSLLAYMLGGMIAGDPSFTLTSPAFLNRHVIPQVYTCRGKNKELPLRWDGEPTETRSLVLIMEDIDAPKHPFFNWVLYDIPPHFFENNKNSEQLINIASVARNSLGQVRYYGPCPTAGTRRYDLTLYALDDRIWEPKDPTVKQLRALMRGHVLGKAKLVGIERAAKKQRSKT